MSGLRRETPPKAAPEESVGLRAAVLVAVMAAALAVLRQDVGGPALYAGVAAIPAAFWFSHRARHRDGFWLKVGLALGVLAAFASFVSSLGAVPAGTLSAAQVPLAELFLWVQLLHALDVPARRDLMFSLVSSLVLMALAGVLSVSMDLLGYLVVWSVAAAAALVLAHRSELRSLAVLGVPSEGTAAARRSLRPVAVVVATVTAVGTAAFFLLPPAGTARALTFPTALRSALPVPELGGLSNPTLGTADPGRGGGRRAGGVGRNRSSFGYFGFSDELDTAVRGRPDDTLVMRVRAAAPDFWRGQTFDVWDGRRWTLSDDRPRRLEGSSPLVVPPGPGEADVPPGDELVQTYHLARPGPNLVFGAGRLHRVYFPDRRLFRLSDGTLRSGVALDEGAVYTVVSERPPVTAALLRAADPLSAGVPPAVAERYLALPPVPDRVTALARRVTASAPTVYDKVRALEAWMSANTRYSLEIPPLPPAADAVEHFLFVDRTGFCEQIASSLVVMLRSLGVPARLAAGYTPGERNPFTGLYEVSADDAHAWAEVWFPGVGWQAFDPTASVPLAGDGGVGRAGSGLADYLSARLPRPPPALVTGVLAGGLAVVVGVAVVRVGRRLGARRRAPRPSWASATLARLEAVGAAHGRERRPGETVSEYAGALRRAGLLGPHLDEVAAVVTADAFSGAPSGPEQRAMVERALGEMEAGRPVPARRRARPATSRRR